MRIILIIAILLSVISSVSCQLNLAGVLNNGQGNMGTNVINGAGLAISTFDPWAFNQFTNQFAFNTLVNQNAINFNNGRNGLNPPINPFQGLGSVLGFGNQGAGNLNGGFNTALGLNNNFLTNPTNTAQRGNNVGINSLSNCALSEPGCESNSGHYTNFSIKHNAGWIVLLIFLGLSCGFFFSSTVVLVYKQYTIAKSLAIITNNNKVNAK